MHVVMEEKYNKKYEEILTALHETNDKEGLEELKQEAANLWREINENLDIEKDNELFTSVYKLDGLIIEKFNEISATSNSNTQTFEPPPADNAKIMEDGQRVKYNEIFDKIEAANSEDDIEELRKASESLVDDIIEKNPDIERDAEKMAALYASMNFLANKINDKGKELSDDMPGISTVVDTIVPPSQDVSSVYPTPVTAPNPTPVTAPNPTPVTAPNPTPVTAPNPTPVAAPNPTPVTAPNPNPVQGVGAGAAPVGPPGNDSPYPREETDLFKVIKNKWGEDNYNSSIYDRDGETKYATYDGMKHYMDWSKVDEYEDHNVKKKGNGFDLFLLNNHKICWRTNEGQIQDGEVPTEEITTNAKKKNFEQYDANAMIALARMRGWKEITVKGNIEQKQMLWLAVQEMNWKEQRVFEHNGGAADEYSPSYVKNFKVHDDSVIHGEWIARRAVLEATYPRLPAAPAPATPQGAAPTPATPQGAAPTPATPQGAAPTPATPQGAAPTPATPQGATGTTAPAQGATGTAPAQGANGTDDYGDLLNVDTTPAAENQAKLAREQIAEDNKNSKTPMSGSGAAQIAAVAEQIKRNEEKDAKLGDIAATTSADKDKDATVSTASATKELWNIGSEEIDDAITVSTASSAAAAPSAAAGLDLLAAGTLGDLLHSEGLIGDDADAAVLAKQAEKSRSNKAREHVAQLGAIAAPTSAAAFAVAEAAKNQAETDKKQLAQKDAPAAKKATPTSSSGVGLAYAEAEAALAKTAATPGEALATPTSSSGVGLAYAEAEAALAKTAADTSKFLKVNNGNTSPEKKPAAYPVVPTKHEPDENGYYHIKSINKVITADKGNSENKTKPKNKLVDHGDGSFHMEPKHGKVIIKDPRSIKPNKNKPQGRHP